MDGQVNSIIQENKARRELLMSPYDPVTGEGSPIARKVITFSAAGQQMCWGFPLAMYEENKVLLDALEAHQSVEATMRFTGQTCDSYSVAIFMKDLMILRFRHDFEFWAFSTVKIQDKKSKQMIPFKLNRPQRKALTKIEKMRRDRVPIRFIICKARQWGGSTLVQIYMAWMQIIQRTGWHSAIVTDVEDQARNIRGMFTKLAQNYPKVLGSIVFMPHEGSTKNRMIKDRGCIIGVGSVQKPDSLRSFDFAMTHMCIAPDTLIPTADGFLKRADEVKPNDQVITHTGQITTIKSVTGNKPGDLNGNGYAVEIKPWLGSVITLTPNHPVYTQRGWIRADQLTKNDWLSYPVRKITHEILEAKLPYYPLRKRGGGITPKANGGTIRLDREVGFALGYYLAEGCPIKTKNRIGVTGIILTRHDNEAEYGDRAVAALMPYISSHIRKKRIGVLTTTEILYGAVLAKWIEENLGTKEHKRIPDWFFKCGEEFLTGILQGYLSGDGSKTNGSQGHIKLALMSVTTVSSSLATQIRDIALSLGFGWAALDIRDAGIYSNRNCKKRYLLRWHGISARGIKALLGQSYPSNGHGYSEKAKVSDGFVWFKIRSISDSNLKYVYDIEVNHNDHSFRTISFSVKNSEVSLWKSTAQKSAEDLAQTLRATVPDVPDSLAAVESSPKGVGNFFHREWLAAKEGKSAYVPIYVAWHEIEMYQKPIEDYEAFVKWMLSDSYAMYLWNLGATLEGIKWYFDTKRGENYDDWRMKSEYSSDDIEAFQSTGARVFSQAYVELARRNNKDPEFIGDVFGKAGKGKTALDGVEFKVVDRGPMYVWGLPDKSINISSRYLVTVDIGGRTEKADFSVIRVIDRYWMSEGGKPEIVATWRGHIDQDLLAWKAAQISKFYNNALLVVESNSLNTEESEGNHFLTVLDEVVKYYPNIYARTEPDKVRQGLPIRYGFQTNMNTKPMVIDTLNGALREEAYIERDRRACDEMDTYEVKENGTYGAVEGCHDDIVMATAIGLWICFNYMPMPKEFTPSSGKGKNRIISEATI